MAEKQRRNLNRWTSPKAEMLLPSEIKHKALQQSLGNIMTMLNFFAHGRMCTSLEFLFVSSSIQGRCRKRERELREGKKPPRLKWTVSVQRPGGRLLELGDESSRRLLIYCRRAGWNPSLLFSPVLCLSPPCPWASDTSGSGVVECREDQSGWRPLIWAQDTWRGQRKKRCRKAEQCAKICMAFSPHCFWMRTMSKLHSSYQSH